MTTEKCFSERVSRNGGKKERSIKTGLDLDHWRQQCSLIQPAVDAMSCVTDRNPDWKNRLKCGRAQNAIITRLGIREHLFGLASSLRCSIQASQTNFDLLITQVCCSKISRMKSTWQKFACTLPNRELQAVGETSVITKT